MNELDNCVSFIVDTRANKIQIKEAIEDSYNVTVQKVRTMTYAPVRKNKYQNWHAKKQEFIIKKPSFN